MTASSSAGSVASLNGDQRSGNRPLLSQQNIEGAHGSAGRHDFHGNTRLLEARSHCRRQWLKRGSGSNKKQSDLCRFFNHARKYRFVQIREAFRPPPVNTGRNAQDRTPVRHVREPEASVAVGFDWGAARKVGRADFYAARHQVLGTVPDSCFDSSSSASSLSAAVPLLAGRRLKKMSAGAEMKTDESVPMTTPNNIEATKERMTSPPNR